LPQSTPQIVVPAPCECEFLKLCLFGQSSIKNLAILYSTLRLIISENRVTKSNLNIQNMETSNTGKQKITPFLWFDGNAEEAMNFYTTVFKNSKIVSVSRYGEAGPGPKGTVMTGMFRINGQEFYALNGGPMYTFSPAISFFINCGDQEEVDELWEKLSEGGQKNQCGWLQDKFGLSWQVIPSVLGELLGDKDPVKSQRVMQAMFKMTKIDIKALKDAYEQQ
jgi:predicted 3-demethylubiquinone-9 3-methyltransferase (glyoxalase superfamily)